MREAISGYHSTDINIVPELHLIDAVVAQARQEARSKNDSIRRRAIWFLKAIRLPVDGPTRQCRLATKKRGKKQVRRENL